MQKESNNMSQQPLQNQQGSNDMQCTVKDMQNQIAELQAKAATLSAKLEGLCVLRGNNFTIRPNRGESYVLSDGTNATKSDKGKKIKLVLAQFYCVDSNEFGGSK